VRIGGGRETDYRRIHIFTGCGYAYSELMRLPDGVTGTVTYDETEVIRRDRKQIRRTGDPRQKAETQIVRAIEQWRIEDATNISINVKKT